jgi:hypothetical protein
LIQGEKMVYEYHPADPTATMRHWAPIGLRQRAGPHIGHRQHLCDMVDRGDVSIDQFKELVKDAKFVCKVCGRAAAKEANLCDPIAL